MTGPWADDPDEPGRERRRRAEQGANHFHLDVATLFLLPLVVILAGGVIYYSFGQSILLGMATSATAAGVIVLFWVAGKPKR